jgi:hypothetical protein
VWGIIHAKDGEVKSFTATTYSSNFPFAPLVLIMLLRDLSRMAEPCLDVLTVASACLVSAENV